jgi:DNA (cytosine-5)-methyltransferase 1
VKPRLLDLFCGAGGAAVGYARAGFEVVGVDIRPQPRFPFAFHQADALTFPLDGFDAIHASPPCQGYTAIRTVNKFAKEWPLLVEPIRERLEAAGVPYVIENVPGAPMRSPLILCGSSFGLRVRRHRLFESNLLLLGPSCNHGPDRPLAVYGDHPENCPTGKINRAPTLVAGQAAMGIEWMKWRELCESIPPAYTEHIGRQLLVALTSRAKAAG